MRSKHGVRQLVPYLAAFFAALVVLPWIGAEPLQWSEILSYLGGRTDAAHGMILFQQRFPRVMLALFVGGALSMTGAALQVLFRNPLAEPWTLGVAGGAAIGAFLAKAFPAFRLTFGPVNSTQALALLGAAAAMGIVWSFARARGAMTAHTLLLTGVTISIVSSSFIMLLIYFISHFEFVAFHRWMMGGLDVIGYRELWSALLLGTPGILLLGCMAREYNHLAFSEDMALGHGVNVPRVQRLTFLGAGLTTAACVAVAGPIGFIGMIIPHIVRGCSDFDYRIVMPGAFLLGGAALAVCDGIARTVIAPTEIPVGVITAVVGGPVFLYLLGKR